MAYQPNTNPYYSNANPYYSFENSSQPSTTYEKYENTPLKEGGNESTKFQESGHWRDLPFAILFLLHLFAIGVVLLVGIVKRGDSNFEDWEGFFPIRSKDFRNVLLIGFFCAGNLIFIIAKTLYSINKAFGGFLSFVFLSFIQKFAKQLIYVCIILSVLLWAAFGVFLLTSGSVVGGVVTLVISVLHCFLFYIWRDRIDFATAVLETISARIQDYPATAYTAYVSLLFQFAWTFIWVLTVAFSQHFSESSLYAASFFLLVSLYWTSQVIKNVVHVTASGTFASWYFLAGTQEGVPRNPTLFSLKRATTTSFGSICLGSLIIALLRALRTIVRSLARKSENNILAWIALCLVNCIEQLVEYFNIYAFTQVAIYGFGFLTDYIYTFILLLFILY